MLRGFNENGELKNVKVGENGELFVSQFDKDLKEVETTLYAGVMNLNTEEQTIGVSKKVTSISIANYSETANVIIDIAGKSLKVGANIALDFPINAMVDEIGLSSTEENTKVQYVVKGVI